MATSEKDHRDWVFQGNYDDPRLSELENLYLELGFSVRTGPLTTGTGEDSRGCQKCFAQEPERFKALYTKKLTGTEKNCK